MASHSIILSNETEEKLQKMMREHTRNISNEIEHLIKITPFKEREESRGCECEK